MLCVVWYVLLFGFIVCRACFIIFRCVLFDVYWLVVVCSMVCVPVDIVCWSLLLLLFLVVGVALDLCYLLFDVCCLLLLVSTSCLFVFIVC